MLNRNEDQGILSALSNQEFLRGFYASNVRIVNFIDEDCWDRIGVYHPLNEVEMGYTYRYKCVTSGAPNTKDEMAV